MGWDYSTESVFLLVNKHNKHFFFGDLVLELNSVGRVFIALSLVCFLFCCIQLQTADAMGFSETGSLNSGQSFHSATKLGDGKVLVVGSGGTDLYDPETQKWTSRAPMINPRDLHSATLLDDGRILVVGGASFPEGSGFTELTSCELYNPVTDTWAIAGSLNVARSEPKATILDNGKVLVTGGGNGNTATMAELYDPATNAWSNAGSISQPRYRHTQTKLHNGEVLIAGGRNSNAANIADLDLAVAEIYNPGTNAWRMVAPMTEPHWSAIGVLLENGKVLVAGGARRTSNQGTIGLRGSEIYDPILDTWTATGQLSTTRTTARASLMCNGQVLISGGFDRELFVSSDSAELYNPNTGLWKEVGPMPVGRSLHSSTLLENCNVLIAGGQMDGEPFVLSSALLYDPSSPTIVPILNLLLEED